MKKSLLVALILVAVVTEEVLAGRDFYKILGVPRNASKRDIKKAHRKLSIDLHPDKNKDPKATERFVEINEAAEVLGDDEKRALYDKHGEEGVMKGKQQGGGGSVFDFFGFGGGFGGQQRGGGNQEERKGPEVVIPLEVSLSDVYNGRELEAQINKQVLCRVCGGSGAASPSDLEKCNVCGGTGVVIKRQQLGPGMVQQFQSTCDKCGGKGEMIKKKCPKCGGAKKVQGENVMYVSIDRGVPEGHRIVMERESDQNPDVTPGDIVFVVTTSRHPTFRRSGNDLHTTMEISLVEALLGFSKPLVHMDGHVVTVKRSEITAPNFVLTVEDEGMPIFEAGAQAGNLYVELKVVMPATLTQAQKDGIRALLG